MLGGLSVLGVGPGVGCTWVYRESSVECGVP